jgi:hypothetical protein
VTEIVTPGQGDIRNLLICWIHKNWHGDRLEESAALGRILFNSLGDRK